MYTQRTHYWGLHTDEYLDRLGFCQEKIDCTRAMLQRSMNCILFVQDDANDVGKYASLIDGIQKPIVEMDMDKADNTTKICEKALETLCLRLTSTWRISLSCTTCM